MPERMWGAVKINCWCLVRKYMFSSNQHWIMQKCKGIRFTDSDLTCQGWIFCALVVFAFATMLGSYLSTFLDSFLSKEIRYSFKSELERQYLNVSDIDQWFPRVIRSLNVTNSMKTKNGHLAPVPFWVSHGARKRSKKERQIKHEIDGNQNWIHNQIWFSSKFNCIWF